MVNFEAASAEKEDGLKFEGHEYDIWYWTATVIMYKFRLSDRTLVD
jgi:hypothetical protein